MKQAKLVPMIKFENSKLPFKIKSLQWLPGDEDEIVSSAHSHDYYEMVWIQKGSGVLKADLQEHGIGSDQLYFLKPGQVHQLETDAEMEGFVLSFTDSFLKMVEQEFDWSCQNALFQLFAIKNVLRIREEMVTELSEVVVDMVKEFNHDYPFRTQLLKNYFRIFLIYLSRQYEEIGPAVKQSRETDLVRSFISMVDKNYREKKMVADYAAELLVTPNYLNGIIKKNTGFSAGHLIRERVVLEAKRLARHSDAGMKEIAYSLGFNDSGHFSKFFKSVSGKNFSDFKKEGISYVLYPQQSLIA
jgi:YesN/AraC family two-component response regulator